MTLFYTYLFHSQEKERELEAKNIYANRMLKPSPRKDTDIVQRKRGNLYKAIKAEKLLASLQKVSAGLYLLCQSVLKPDAACSSTFTFLHFFQHSTGYKTLVL